MDNLVTDLERLRDVALDQHGFVTTAQALASGVSQPSLAMMVRRGRVERVAHGVYRVFQVPQTQFDQFHLAVFWAAVPEACLSHDTALELWEICDINPTRIDVTVGAKRRIGRKSGQGYTLHYQDLTPEQVTWNEAIPCVTPLTAIEQGIVSGVPTYLIRQAIDNSARKHMIRDSDHTRLIESLEERYVR